MEIIFTRQDGVVSRLIRKLTGETVSHVAFIYMGNVYHSNHKGATICSLTKFKEDSEIVYRLKLPRKYELCFHYQFARLEGSNYDLPAALYAGWRIFLNRYFKVGYPPVNKFNFKEAYMCTELAQKVLKIDVDSFITPHALYLKVKDMID